MIEELYQNKYRIKSARLPGWNYGADAYYFITICTYERAHYFGNVLCDDGGVASVALSEIGKIAWDCWLEIPKHFPFVVLDMFVVMPNHIHGIIVIRKNEQKCDDVETQNFASLHNDGWQPNRFGPQSQNLASIIRGFKIGVTKYANNNNIDFKWQSRYYDHIIRDERALRAIRRYIQINSQKWNRDRNNPNNIWM